MIKHPGVVVLIFLFLFVSCSWLGESNRGERVARVNNNYLYTSDLDGIIGPGTGDSDSAVIIKRYIENWVRQQVYLEEAEKYLSDDQTDFHRKVEDYRNSLIRMNLNLKTILFRLNL